MSRRFWIAFSVLSLVSCGARAALADSLNIVVSESGTAYYQVNGGNWSPVTANSEATQGSSNSWDSMVTSPGVSSPTVGPTEAYSISSMNGPNISFSFLQSTQSDWQAASVNTSGNSEAGLILTTSGTTAGSTVSNLIVLDGQGYIYVYNAPKVSGTTTPIAQYGYTNGFIGTNGNPNGLSYNPANGTPANVPITQLGTLTSGLEGDLENNAGFAGSGGGKGNGTNIGVGADTVVNLATVDSNLVGLPSNLHSFIGYGYNSDTAGIGDPDQLRETTTNGTFIGYVSPTIYFAAGSLPGNAPVGLPNSAASMCALLGLIGIASYGRRAFRMA